MGAIRRLTRECSSPSDVCLVTTILGCTNKDETLPRDYLLELTHHQLRESSRLSSPFTKLKSYSRELNSVLREVGRQQLRRLRLLPRQSTTEMRTPKPSRASLLPRKGQHPSSFAREKPMNTFWNHKMYQVDDIEAANRNEEKDLRGPIQAAKSKESRKLGNLKLRRRERDVTPKPPMVLTVVQNELLCSDYEKGKGGKDAPVAAPLLAERNHQYRQSRRQKIQERKERERKERERRERNQREFERVEQRALRVERQQRQKELMINNLVTRQREYRERVRAVQEKRQHERQLFESRKKQQRQRALALAPCEQGDRNRRGERQLQAPLQQPLRKSCWLRKEITVAGDESLDVRMYLDLCNGCQKRVLPDTNVVRSGSLQAQQQKLPAANNKKLIKGRRGDRERERESQQMDEIKTEWLRKQPLQRSLDEESSAWGSACVDEHRSRMNLKKCKTKEKQPRQQRARNVREINSRQFLESIDKEGWEERKKQLERERRENEEIKRRIMDETKENEKGEVLKQREKMECVVEWAVKEGAQKRYIGEGSTSTESRPLEQDRETEEQLYRKRENQWDMLLKLLESDKMKRRHQSQESEDINYLKGKEELERSSKYDTELRTREVVEIRKTEGTEPLDTHGDEARKERERREREEFEKKGIEKRKLLLESQIMKKAERENMEVELLVQEKHKKQRENHKREEKKQIKRISREEPALEQPLDEREGLRDGTEFASKRNVDLERICSRETTDGESAGNKAQDDKPNRNTTENPLEWIRLELERITQEAQKNRERKQLEWKESEIKTEEKLVKRAKKKELAFGIKKYRNMKENEEPAMNQNTYLSKMVDQMPRGATEKKLLREQHLKGDRLRNEVHKKENCTEIEDLMREKEKETKERVQLESIAKKSELEFERRHERYQREKEHALQEKRQEREKYESECKWRKDKKKREDLDGKVMVGVFERRHGTDIEAGEKKIMEEEELERCVMESLEIRAKEVEIKQKVMELEQKRSKKEVRVPERERREREPDDRKKNKLERRNDFDWKDPEYLRKMLRNNGDELDATAGGDEIEFKQLENEHGKNVEKDEPENVDWENLADEAENMERIQTQLQLVTGNYLNLKEHIFKALAKEKFQEFKAEEKGTNKQGMATAQTEQPHEDRSQTEAAQDWLKNSLINDIQDRVSDHQILLELNQILPRSQRLVAIFLGTSFSDTAVRTDAQERLEAGNISGKSKSTNFSSSGKKFSFPPEGTYVIKQQSCLRSLSHSPITNLDQESGRVEPQLKKKIQMGSNSPPVSYCTRTGRKRFRSELTSYKLNRRKGLPHHRERQFLRPILSREGTTHESPEALCRRLQLENTMMESNLAEARVRTRQRHVGETMMLRAAEVVKLLRLAMRNKEPKHEETRWTENFGDTALNGQNGASTPCGLVTSKIKKMIQGESLWKVKVPVRLFQTISTAMDIRGVQLMPTASLLEFLDTMEENLEQHLRGVLNSQFELHHVPELLHLAGELEAQQRSAETISLEETCRSSQWYHKQH
ncbi:blast:Trichohyalin [Drosophila guanche]|uniref:Blast:Trichohyalin n=1 Tax=Drosophila guanche TaxID=7266 RepID=A0A3B0K6A7_DROGU|nr:blast:Trichohyalin [Drosophila guanche]